MDLDTRARSAAQGIRRAVEVMEMSTHTQQPKKVERFDQYQERKDRNRKVGALAVAAAIMVVLALVAVTTLQSSSTTPAGPPPPISWPISAPGTGAFTVDLTTGTATPLPASIRYTGSAYAASPDHKLFAYNANQGFGLFIANIDGTGEREISSGNAMGPQWSPDGSMLVYQQRSSDPASIALGNLFIYDVRTGRSTQITHLDQSMRTGGWWFMDPSFTFGPGGLNVLFQMPRGTNPQVWDLWAVPVSGGKPVLVKNNAGWGGVQRPGDPGDAGQFAYAAPVSARTFNGGALYLEVHIFNSPYGNGRRLVPGPAIKLRWSPDGTRIAYTSGSYVCVLNVARGSVTKVVKGDNAEWFDDNTLIVGN
jgi:hypothetical protein